MRHRKRIRAGIASSTVIAAVLLVAPSQAPAATVEPKITIRYDAGGDFLSGWVRSSREGCNIARYPLRVFRKRPGKDLLFQKFGTYDDGYWRTSPPTPKGRYYAKLKKYRYDNVVCKKAQSRSVTVPG